MKSLLSSETVVRVSSVLNKDIKQYGKSFMFDGKEDTCWNSDQGLPQCVQIEFPKPMIPKSVELKFQGGFVGQTCCIESFCNTHWEEVTRIYPQDINSLQHFVIDSHVPVKKMKLVFLTSSDFYGRVTVYHLDVKGVDVGTEADL